MGSGGFEKVLIGTRGARETFLRGRKGRAAKNSVLTSGAKQLKCYCELGSGPPVRVVHRNVIPREKDRQLLKFHDQHPMSGKKKKPRR